ncbi:periplasmic heavy metal sensor [Thermodesulfobacteriota bacterium B35]
MKKGTILIAALAIALTFAATQGFAWMHGQMMTGHMTGAPATTLTADQQKQAREIEARYQKQLAAQEGALQAKAGEIRTALADTNTTLGQANALRNELFNLEQQYWQLRMQVNREISQAIGSPYYGAMGWGPQYCSWHNHGGGHGYGSTGNAYGPMAMGCDW